MPQLDFRFHARDLKKVTNARPSLVLRHLNRQRLIREAAGQISGNARWVSCCTGELQVVRQQFALDTVRLSGAHEVLAEVAQAADAAITTLEKQLPHGFPEYIHEAVKAGLTKRLKNL